MMLGDADAPRFIHRELPKYPLSARKFGKEGNVVLRLALDTQGQLEGIEVIEANGFGFAESAQAAIRKSTFAPAFKNGRAISSQVLVPIRFVLHEGQ
jgi:protein TonB